MRVVTTLDIRKYERSVTGWCISADRYIHAVIRRRSELTSRSKRRCISPTVPSRTVAIGWEQCRRQGIPILQ